MLNATIVERINVTKDLIRLFVKPDKPWGSFLSGQYVALGLPGSAPRPSDFPPENPIPDPDKIIKRAYSIGSSADQNGVLEFYLAILPNGHLTSRLALVKPGDKIFASPKITGTFTLVDIPPSHNLVLVSTGTGIAPFVSMIKTSSTWIERRSIVLVHGARYVQDLAYQDELLELTGECPRFSYYNTVSRPDKTWQGKQGYVQDFFKQDLIRLDPEHDHVFLCGNPSMIDDMQALLETKSYKLHSKKQPGNLHVEK